MPTDKWFLLWMNLTFLALVAAEEVLLSVASPEEKPDFLVFNRPDDGESFVPEHHDIHKRAAIVNSTQESDGSKHVISYVTRLNTSHQQLLVHWSGMGSDVLICLAKNNQPLGYKQNATPSALYISYNYGQSFVNKTDFFKLKNGGYASLDKFFFHKKEKKYMIFIDKYNKMIFTTKDFGKNIANQSLNFEPTDVLTHPYDPWIFLVYDTKQKLRITYDFGQSFSDLQEMVKSYFWMDIYPPGKSTTEVALIVQRLEPTYSTALALTIGQAKPQMRVLISKIDQILSSGNFMFAIRKLPSNKTSELFISYRGGDFLHTEFDSNLDKKSFHVTDTSDTRLMIAVSHTETLSNLYISDLEANQEKYLFRLSLERLFCFFPSVMWVDSWLTDLAEGPFADIHKVQGMKGIYLASQVVADAQEKTISPQHLTSVITFDWGGEWKPLEPPKYDMLGRPTNASKAQNVSLHVTQKFMYLYPVTRNIPILTSKSAPGIIIATGTVGSSLKGHVGVYVSRDAGLTWNHVLRENYLFNMGDHGGIFTAVKLYKNVGETFEVLYSLDEGETWTSFKFAEKPMRIYGLMTEPGENTTVFTIFGSEPEKHEWTIINIDFLKAFRTNCTNEDYKMWSPSSGDPRDKMSCVMGVKETYQRRIRHTQCRNGVGYDRSKSFENCPCDYEDFECDYGFLRHVSSPDCIKNKSLTYDPYAIPADCKPGQFYKRTKGYRRIDGDACIGGFEHYYLPDNIPCPLKEPNQFLLLAQKEHIIRFDLLDPQPKTLPINNLHNVIAIDYDMKNNCVYFADIVTDVIGRQCFSSGKEETEILLESSMRSVEGIAFDWISNLLYFVDGNRAKIEVIRTDINNYGRMRYTVLDSKSVRKPRGIAIHPVKGYMFWTDWDEHKPGVNRANMDGSGIKTIRDSNDVHWPNGITIDHISERVYWVDAKLDYIGSADLEGRHFKKILTTADSRMHHPFSVAVFKDTMYWDDWTEDSIFMADKDRGTGILPFAVLYPGLMDVKVFGHSLQEGTNACDPSNKRCSHLCLALPDNKFRCACPDGMVDFRGECKCLNDHQVPFPNGTCPRSSVNATCAEGQFSCSNGNCIPKVWQCDKDNDCGDNSDEAACETPCMGAFFDCGHNRCIPSTWKCDQEQDCEDGRDELSCPVKVCDPGKFMCKNNRCINERWVCDGENDCKDGSDEINCNTTAAPKEINCTGSQFQCNIGSTVQCIPRVWVCDGENDCYDKKDEQNCEHNKCDPYIQFQCEKTHLCILKSYRCDGSNDCGVGDDSDEKNCPSQTTTPPPASGNNTCKGWMFRCNNNVCIPSWWKCDEVDDCGDNSDEEGCTDGDEKTTSRPFSPPHSIDQCKPFEFRCNNAACIAQSWVCDGTWDCPSGEDESHCENDMSRNMTCSPDYFKCKKTRMCIPEYKVCDDVPQCPDGSDEKGCDEIQPARPENPVCGPGFFACDGSRCLPLSRYCNGFADCYDGTDEDNCPTDPLNRTYQVTQFGVDKYQTKPTSLTAFWWVANAPPRNVSQLQYLPSIAEILDSGAQKWKNASSWTSELRHSFTNLVPFTEHNITVYVRLVKGNKEFPPGSYVTGTTAAAAPSEPREVKAGQKKADVLEVSWLPPIKANGNISRYEVFYKPPVPPIRTDVRYNDTSVHIHGHFIHGQTYTVWVNAVNQAGYKASQITTFTATNASTVPAIKYFVVKSINDTSVTWSWNQIEGADGYKFEVTAEYPYAHLPPVTITPASKTNYSFTNLAPGVDYTFYIRAFHKDFEGPRNAKGGRTSGDELPVVPGLKATLSPSSGSSILVQWTAPKVTKAQEKWQYGVYYSTSSDDFFDGAKNVTFETHLQISGLGACEKYLVDVGLVGPLGHGPLSAAPVTVTTGYDPLAPPKRLRVMPDRVNDTLVHIMWSSSCFNMTDVIGYILTIQDAVIGKTTSITFLPTNKTERVHKLPVHLGGRYLVRVQTDRVGSRLTDPVTYVAPPLPPPHQVETHIHNDGSHINVYWADPLEKNKILPKFKYELLVSEGKPMNESEAKIIPVESSPYEFNEIKTGTVYYFAVRTVTERGHKSALSEIMTEELPLGPWASVMTPTRVIGIFVPVLLVLMIVAGAFVIFVFRHRRLQNNFASFANSHYSTRSGAATFTSDGLGAFDDEDSPVIRGFSDDEPLVVA